MTLDEYKKTLSRRTRFNIWWLVQRDTLLYPYYRYIHCTHSSATSAVDSDTEYCLNCHREVVKGE